MHEAGAVISSDEQDSRDDQGRVGGNDRQNVLCVSPHFRAARFPRRARPSIVRRRLQQPLLQPGCRRLVAHRRSRARWRVRPGGRASVRVGLGVRRRDCRARRRRGHVRGRARAPHRVVRAAARYAAGAGRDRRSAIISAARGSSRPNGTPPPFLPSDGRNGRGNAVLERRLSTCRRKRM